MITVVDWISEADSAGKEMAVGTMGGWFGFDKSGDEWKPSGDRWADYIKDVSPEFAEYLEAIRKSVVERGLRLTGEQHQEDPHGVPLFSDGKIASFSWRGWGDLMAAIWSEEENKDYNYMNFYM